MKLTALLTSTLSAGMAAADTLTIVTRCTPIGTECNSRGSWRTDENFWSGPYNFNDGCQKTDIPSFIEEICPDWGEGLNRAHYYYRPLKPGDPRVKRCVQQIHVAKTHDDYDGKAWIDIWNETPCTWDTGSE
ncbi:hypothetical protein B0T14DRAFT_567347 [Immersiella caudata]|uniref:Uncharacterized protein n=1 Tax=Immersiella caudata TaxID=314043 RepID=A0AA39WS62_9PEZI|nr:hypothetical protein B0T14DRAFT_567347 [Immersiella caudata]